MFWFFVRLAVITLLLWAALAFSAALALKWVVGSPDPVAVECKLA